MSTYEGPVSSNEELCKNILPGGPSTQFFDFLAGRVPIAQHTRFAPGLTGQLHVGSITNALANWLAARMTGGKFGLRFDGGGRNEATDTIRDDMLRVLEAAGLDWDWKWEQRENREDLTERFRTWIGMGSAAREDLFVCRCTNEDIEQRFFATGGGDNWRTVPRPEKYPPRCLTVDRFGISDGQGRIVPGGWYYSSIAHGEFLLDPPGQRKVRASWSFGQEEQKNRSMPSPETGQWRPWSTGHLGPYTPPGASFYPSVKPCGGPVSYTVEFPHHSPPFEVTAFYRNGKIATERVEGQLGPSVVTRPLPLPEGTTYEEITQVRLSLTGVIPEVQRPYYYDGHCAGVPLPGFEKPKNSWANAAKEQREELLRDPSVVLRLMPPSTKWSRTYTAVYYDCTPNLAWWSPVMDQSLGVNCVIRGADLVPFSLLEQPTAYLLNYGPHRLYHPLATDSQNVKLSKSVGSAPVTPQTAGQALAAATVVLGLNEPDWDEEGFSDYNAQQCLDLLRSKIQAGPQWAVGIDWE